MPLNSKQIITTEDLQTYSVCGYNPLVSYVVGNNVKDPITGDIYKCTTNAPAGTLLSDPAFFSTLSAAGLPPLPAASDAQALAKASSAVAITPSNLAALTASSADAITGTDTNKFLTAKSLADTLNNVATVGTNTKFGTLKTASSADALAGTATDKALTASNIPDITASSAESAAKTITNKFINPADLAGMNSLALASDTYNASTNSPTLASMKDGDIYKVSTEGIQTIGGVSSFCAVGDLIAKANGATFFMLVNPVSYNAANGQTAGGLTVSFTQLSQLGRIVNITTSGSVTGAIAGAVVGAGSYLIAGDQVQYSSNGLSLVNLEIEPNTTINYGTGSSFGTLGLLNTYINKRSYTSLTLNQLSATTETASLDVSNDCDGRLVIMGNGFLIDFSGALNLYCTVTGNNVFWDTFNIKLNLQRTVLNGLVIKGELEYSNNCKVENINVTGDAMMVYGKLRNYTTGLLTLVAGFICGPTAQGGSSFYTNGGVTTVGGSYAGFYAGEAGSNYFGGAIDTGGGAFNAGGSSSNYFGGAIDTGGGQFNAGGSSSNYFGGAIDTGGGQFTGGASCSNYFGGAITTGGGQFHGGNSSSNYFGGAITTGGGQFHAGGSSSNYFNGLVACGVGQLNFGELTNNIWGNGATGTGGVDSWGGSQNNCNGQPMPAGTPASGTNTAAFSRVG